MKARIQKLRTTLDLTQQEFAAQIGLTKNYISLVENGARIPSDRTISDICREFSVNEAWLRTGEGEMFREVPREKAIADFVFSAVNGTNDFKRRLVETLARTTEEEWKVLADLAERLRDEMIDENKP